MGIIYEPEEESYCPHFNLEWPQHDGGITECDNCGQLFKVKRNSTMSQTAFPIPRLDFWQRLRMALLRAA